MPLAVDCPACKGPLLFDPSLFGRPIQCPACGHPFTVEPPADGASTDRPAQARPRADDVHPIAALAAARRSAQQERQWRSVRFGFLLVFLASLLLVGVAAAVANLFLEAHPTSETVDQLLYLQGACLILLFVILVGQLMISAVPAECGRLSCVVSLVATLGLLVLTAAQTYLTSDAFSPGGWRDHDAARLTRLLAFLTLPVEVIALVAWYLFLARFGEYHGRFGLSGVCFFAIVWNLLWFTVCVLALMGGAVRAAVEGLAKGDGTAFGWMLAVAGGGFVSVALHIGTLLTARNLIGTGEEQG